MTIHIDHVSLLACSPSWPLDRSLSIYYAYGKHFQNRKQQISISFLEEKWFLLATVMHLLYWLSKLWILKRAEIMHVILNSGLNSIGFKV